jgi:hypothetical protein
MAVTEIISLCIITQLTMYANQTTNCNLPTLQYGFVPHHEVVEQTAQYIVPPDSFCIHKRFNVR